ncbi:MAG: transglutaminase domain-containing protein [Anaerolineales bacterium]|uniref:transglutaminase-like domain-containing protein n=1 Tax=Candidatus Villigracilis proximus TaxID=3140683 RepID=UPI0031376D67|nr:transglutaminase domain-containing protein [Anaerolineales bacterium]
MWLIIFFDLKQGYCDYYATSMVVLARAAGLPARLVIGYANGTYDAERAQYIVTENYAHSRSRFIFRHRLGEFEPTASEPVIQYEEKMSSLLLRPSLPAERSFVEKLFHSCKTHLREHGSLPSFYLFVVCCGSDMTRSA